MIQNLISINLKFSGRKFQSQHKLVKKYQYNTVSLKNLHSAHLTLQRIYSCNTAKNLTHFTNFPGNFFPDGIRKTFAMHYF